MLLAALPCSATLGQTKNLNPNVNYLLDANGPPGFVASSQAARGVPSIGTFQPVAIQGPEGLKVALARDGFFLDNIDAPVTTAMMVGATYRFRIANIPFKPGVELFPTVEIIDRLHAPAGREHRFPIPVEITREDVELALRGALVTRVIYLEDSEIAAPVSYPAGQRPSVTVAAHENALQRADQMGRPVAILRIGSRVPSAGAFDMNGFLYGCPPWSPLTATPDRKQLVEQNGWPEIAPVVPAEQIFNETPETDAPRATEAW
jgi:hypothetical protein